MQFWKNTTTGQPSDGGSGRPLDHSRRQTSDTTQQQGRPDFGTGRNVRYGKKISEHLARFRSHAFGSGSQQSEQVQYEVQKPLAEYEIEVWRPPLDKEEIEQQIAEKKQIIQDARIFMDSIPGRISEMDRQYKKAFNEIERLRQEKGRIVHEIEEGGEIVYEIRAELYTDYEEYNNRCKEVFEINKEIHKQRAIKQCNDKLNPQSQKNVELQDERRKWERDSDSAQEELSKLEEQLRDLDRSIQEERERRLRREVESQSRVEIPVSRVAFSENIQVSPHPLSPEKVQIAVEQKIREQREYIRDLEATRDQIADSMWKTSDKPLEDPQKLQEQFESDTRQFKKLLMQSQSVQKKLTEANAKLASLEAQLNPNKRSMQESKALNTPDQQQGRAQTLPSRLQGTRGLTNTNVRNRSRTVPELGAQSGTESLDLILHTESPEPQLASTDLDPDRSQDQNIAAMENWNAMKEIVEQDIHSMTEDINNIAQKMDEINTSARDIVESRYKKFMSAKKEIEDLNREFEKKPIRKFLDDSNQIEERHSKHIKIFEQYDIKEENDLRRFLPERINLKELKQLVTSITDLDSALEAFPNMPQIIELRDIRSTLEEDLRSAFERQSTLHDQLIHIDSIREKYERRVQHTNTPEIIDHTHTKSELSYVIDKAELSDIETRRSRTLPVDSLSDAEKQQKIKQIRRDIEAKSTKYKTLETAIVEQQASIRQIEIAIDAISGRGADPNLTSYSIETQIKLLRAQQSSQFARSRARSGLTDERQRQLQTLQKELETAERLDQRLKQEVKETRDLLDEYRKELRRLLGRLSLD